MIENTVTTDPQNVQTIPSREQWELAQHRDVEHRVYDILAFVRTAIGNDREDREVTLDNSSREGLAQILHFAGSLLLDASWSGYGGPSFYTDNPDMCSAFNQLKYPGDEGTAKA